jgi:hypothetical protein
MYSTALRSARIRRASADAQFYVTSTGISHPDWLNWLLWCGRLPEPECAIAFIKDLEAYMYTTKFNPVQEHLLRMFEFVQSENTLKELKEILFKYYHAKLEQKLDEMWQDGSLDQKRLDAINEMDLHRL